MFAFFVLMVMTQNIIVAVFNVISILGVLITITGMVYYMGWHMGIVESLGLDLFIGFSVDYIVHVGHCYVDSIYDSRKARMDNAYKNIGGAVLSGCMTTSISAFFMLPFNFRMINQFGILLIITLMSSLYFSLVLFPALIYIIGPEYKRGNLKVHFWDPLVMKINSCRDKNSNVKIKGPQEEETKLKKGLGEDVIHEDSREGDEFDEDQYYDEEDEEGE